MRTMGEVLSDWARLKEGEARMRSDALDEVEREVMALDHGFSRSDVLLILRRLREAQS